MDVFHVDSTHQLRERAEAVIGHVKENGCALIRGLFSRDAIRKCADSVYAHTNRATHLASGGVSRESVRKNISKWSIGSVSASQAGVSRFMLMIYNPMACADIFRLHRNFRTLIEARDILAMRDEVLFDEKLPPPLFNGTRIQIYPEGWRLHDRAPRFRRARRKTSKAFPIPTYSSCCCSRKRARITSRAEPISGAGDTLSIRKQEASRATCWSMTATPSTKWRTLIPTCLSLHRIYAAGPSRSPPFTISESASQQDTPRGIAIADDLTSGKSGAKLAAFHESEKTSKNSTVCIKVEPGRRPD